MRFLEIGRRECFIRFVARRVYTIPNPINYVTIILRERDLRSRCRSIRNNAYIQTKQKT